MVVSDAQKEVRQAFLGGFVGQLVSGLLWLASAALGTWGTPARAILVIVVGGFFIFPLTQAGLRAIGGGRLHRENPLNGLAMQVAFIVVGAHYLPFAFLYGMRMFLALAGILIAAGLVIGLYAAGSFATGGWFTAMVLGAFAVIGRALVVNEERNDPVARGVPLGV